MNKINVLCVCMGNICRSPTAQGVFQHTVKVAGLDQRLGCDSAGTHGYHIGDAPDAAQGLLRHIRTAYRL